MLRMGRGSKPEQTENDRTAQPPPAYHTPERAHVSQQPAEPPRVAQQQQPVASNTTMTRAVTEAESLAREIKDGTMSGFVGGGTVLTGEVVFKGMLRVDGHLSGSVRSEKGTLIVSSGGRVDADIEVAVARVNGTVNGDITATERIEFGRTARVNGNIQTPALAIEQGAVFEGVCRMARPEPQGTARRELVSAAEAAAAAVESRSNG
ncbi:MAG TPA: polymer-forming cytoskeletal protein, partial [Pyrinomonadaceae bacterium]|nr:polymer-forming cytoskeletal protein [Pyrinomonadaceae bacterium]